jgi:hypothetical protein
VSRVNPHPDGTRQRVPSARVDHTEVKRDRGQPEQDAPKDHPLHRFGSQIAIAGEKTHAQNAANRAVTATYPDADRFMPISRFERRLPAS